MNIGFFSQRQLQRFITAKFGIIIFSLCLTFIRPLSCFSQTGDVEFVARKIAAAYPGFSSKTTASDFEKVVQEAIREYGTDTFRVIARIAYFFNDQHLRVVGANNYLLKDSLVCRKNKETVVAYLSGRFKKKLYEGFWLDDEHDCIIGLIQDKPDHYAAYVIEVSGGNLIPGQIKGTFQEINKRKFYADSYINYSGKRSALTAVFRSDTLFTVGGSNKWRRMENYVPSILATYSEANENVSGMQLSSSTYLLTVPGSTKKNVFQIDSIIKADYQTIVSCENLIVDIRNNAGGRSAIFAPLLPLAYTQPYAAISSSIYCSEDGIKQQEEVFESYRKSGMDSVSQTAWTAYIKKMHDSIGRFISRAPDTIKFDTVQSMPKHIGIVINFATQSAAEMLALTLQHSKKVTIFGENSIGAIDYLSFYPMDFPSGKYQLYMPLSKRHIPEGQHPLDGVGIAPDIRISDSVPDWIAFVKKYYERH